MKKGSKKCPDCTAVNDNKASFCIKCGANLDKDKVASVTDKKSVKNKENGSSFWKNKGDVLATISLLLFLLIYYFSIMFWPFFVYDDILASLLQFLFTILHLALIVIMIMGRIKYPDNKFLKVVMWLIIAFVAMFLIFYIFLYISCGHENLNIY